MLQVVFASKPTDFATPSLLNVLLTARQNNALHGLTGALIYRDDLFLQMLEGEVQTVRKTLKRISADARHTEIALLYERRIPSRTFAAWHMYDDALDKTRWSREAVRDKQYLDMPTSEILALFTRLSAKRLVVV